ncbi:MAG: SDR family NAD(P)-dependent oxidoreductase [Alphaproteobacteria bacterium]
MSYGPFSVAGKAALVTGATSGIGRACAEVLAAAGAKVLVTGRDEERGRAVRDGIRRAGGAAEFRRLDVTDPRACEAGVAAAVESFGRLDILVNDAGVNAGGSVLDTTDEDWLRVLDTNLGGVFAMSRAAVPAMRAKGGGVIVNIASDWSLFASAKAAAYCTSKGGVLMLTKAMALDHARQGIRVNCVCPAEIDTPMLDVTATEMGMAKDAARKAWGEALPIGRIGRPEEVAWAVLYLASDAAGFLTGVALPVDGGSTSR